MSLGLVILIGAVALAFHLAGAYLVAGWARRKGYSFLGFFLLGATATWMTSGALAFALSDRTRRPKG